MSTTSFDAGCGTNISAGIGRSGERPAPSGNRRASMFWRGALCTSAECRRGKALGEPYDGKRHVRFDEGTLETEQWARLRHRHVAKAAGQQSSLALIPYPIDQNLYAQSRSPMDMIRHGWSTSLFQASQQWSTRLS